MMDCITLTGISNHVMRDLENRVLLTIEIRSPQNFFAILNVNVSDPIFLSQTSRNDVSAGTTGIISRVQRRDISMHKIVQSNDLFYEERETMLARIQLVAEGIGRVQRIVRSELGGAMVVAVAKETVYAAR
ncbi:MAG: DUF473 domain-containing protein [Euryarchaeota archaeon]|nr:MAG: hypothetical protein C5S47_04615 [ANME-2 cluster archaeon]MEA1864850.1 DUF473 domain-containing protein [Euryarchaeota archaeon]